MVRAVHVVIEAQNGRMQSSRVQPDEIVVEEAVAFVLYSFCVTPLPTGRSSLEVPTLIALLPRFVIEYKLTSMLLLTQAFLNMDI